jgi:hypothetical protein
MPTKKDDSFAEIEDPSVIREEILMPSNLETIDLSMYDFVDNLLDIYTTTNKGFKKVPVIWVSGERAHHVKENKARRDSNDNFILPAITIERVGVRKDLLDKSAVWGDPPDPLGKGGIITVARRIKQDKTANFANAAAQRLHKQINFPRKNPKVIYETASIPLPVYLQIDYSVNIQTEYQQQMNEILTPFATIGAALDHFILQRDGHTYEGFVKGDFTTDTNLSNLGEEERRYNTEIKVEVLGYVIGDGKNQSRQKIVYRENIVDVKIGRERVIVGDLPEHTDKGDYRD